MLKLWQVVTAFGQFGEDLLANVQQFMEQFDHKNADMCLLALLCGRGEDPGVAPRAILEVLNVDALRGKPKIILLLHQSAADG